MTDALLVLADGETFEGVSVGYEPSDGKRFLHNLDDAVAVLRQPDAGDYLPGGKNAVRAGSVQDLVKSMAERGLRFAPAVNGDEKAYAAFRDAFRGQGPERYPVSVLTPGS